MKQLLAKSFSGNNNTLLTMKHICKVPLEEMTDNDHNGDTLVTYNRLNCTFSETTVNEADTQTSLAGHPHHNTAGKEDDGAAITPVSSSEHVTVDHNWHLYFEAKASALHERGYTFIADHQSAMQKRCKTMTISKSKDDVQGQSCSMKIRCI